MKYGLTMVAALVLLGLTAPTMAQHHAVWDATYNEALPGDTVTVWLKLNHLTSNWNWNYVHNVFWYSDASLINGVSWIAEDATHSSPYLTSAQTAGLLDTAGGFAWWGANIKYWVPFGYGHYPTVGEDLVGYQFQIASDAPIGSQLKIGLEFAFGNSPNVPNIFDNIYQFDRIENDGDPLDPDCLVIQIGTAGAPGDFDGDGDVDTDDIDILCDNLGDGAYDLDDDGDADEDDMVKLIEELVELTDGSGRIGTQRGDFNLDGLINATDLATMNANFGSSSGMKYGEGNANCDDLINATDLAILAANFGYVAPAGAVPEPITMSLLGIGGVALLRRRSRLLRRRK